MFMLHLQFTSTSLADIQLHIAQLCDLYNNDAIFDKFACCVGGDGHHFATGSYRFVLLPEIVAYDIGNFLLSLITALGLHI